MNCIKCKAIIPDGSIYCNYCGKKQVVSDKKQSRKVRGNGMGCAYKRKNTWTACVTVGWHLPKDPSKPKLPVRRTKGGFASKKEAIAYCPVLLAGRVSARQSVPRLREYWELYSNADMLSLAKNTQSAYKTAWKKLKSIHDVPMDTVTVDILRSAVSDACHTYDTAKDCKDLLSNLFRLAAADQVASRDLPSYIILPGHEESERIPFSREEQQKIWKAYDNGDKRAAVHLVMIYTGMMPGEAQALKAENINLGEKIIVRSGIKTKVRKNTPIVIADCLLPVLQDLMDNAMPSGYIWKRNEKEWYQNYYDLLSATGCRRLPPYSCRHTTATALAVDANIAPQTIKKIMRWSTTRMLDRYAHPNTDDALAGVNAISK